MNRSVTGEVKATGAVAAGGMVRVKKMKRRTAVGQRREDSHSNRQVRGKRAGGGAVNKRGGRVSADTEEGGGKELGRGTAHLSISLLPPSIATTPPQSLFVTASHSGSVELGIVHLIRSLMHF